jgi:hypothetical protein
MDSLYRIVGFRSLASPSEEPPEIPGEWCKEVRPEYSPDDKADGRRQVVFQRDEPKKGWKQEATRKDQDALGPGWSGRATRDAPIRDGPADQAQKE